MNHLEFDRLLAEGTLPPVLLFEGEEAWLKQQAWQALRQKLLPAGLEELNETLLDAPETDVLIAAAETMPLITDRRLVLVRDLPGLTGRGEADDRLAEYLTHAPETVLIILYCTQKPDARRKIYTTLKKAGAIVTFSPLRDQELTSFVTRAFRELGKECDERTADFLIFTSGTDTQLLLQEIRKIAAHAGDAASIHPDDVRLLATPSAETTVFQMVDALVAGQQAKTFQLLRTQLLYGAERVSILALLLRQFRLMQHIKIMQYDKRDKNFIRSALGVPPFAVDQYIRQASAYTGRQVRDAVRLCLDTDYAIKSGRLNAEGALEMVVLKLLNIRNKD